MQFLKLDFKKIFSLVSFFSVCIVIYTLQQARLTPSLPFVPQFISQSLLPMYNGLAESIGKTTRQYMDLMSIKDKMERLQINNQELQAQLQVFEEISAENARLKTILDLKDEHPKYQFITAKVMAKDLFSDHFSLFISKGAAEGVEKLSGVISPLGVVGYVIEVQEHTSRLLLISDRLISVDATVQRTRSRGIISGHVDGDSLLKFIDRPQEMSTDDLIVTSDDQKMFPIGFPIGHVKNVHVSPYGVGHYAVVKPVIDLKKLDEVIILKTNEHDKK